MKANLDHLVQDGPQKALTGPVERGDTTTVAKHLACLPQGDGQQLYRWPPAGSPVGRKKSIQMSIIVP